MSARKESPIAQQSTLTSGPPLDYAFKELKTPTDILYTEPVSGKPRLSALQSDQRADEYLESLDNEPQPVASSSGVKYNSTCVKLCNNTLTTVNGIDRVLRHVLDDPSQLLWLDLSCNQLSNIEDVILTFPNLQVLYLHANHLHHLGEVLKLARLPHLSKLTLHGNPISEQPNYKLYVAAHLPGLRSLDFSSITKVDRDKIDTWFRGYKKIHDPK